MFLKHCVAESSGDDSYYEHCNVAKKEGEWPFRLVLYARQDPSPSRKLCIFILRTILLDRYWSPHLKTENTKFQVSEVTKETISMMGYGYGIPQPNPLPFPLGINPTVTDHPKEHSALQKT